MKSSVTRICGALCGEAEPQTTWTGAKAAPTALSKELDDRVLNELIASMFHDTYAMTGLSKCPMALRLCSVEAMAVSDDG